MLLFIEFLDVFSLRIPLVVRPRTYLTCHIKIIYCNIFYKIFFNTVATVTSKLRMHVAEGVNAIKTELLNRFVVSRLRIAKELLERIDANREAFRFVLRLLTSQGSNGGRSGNLNGHTTNQTYF